MVQTSECCTEAPYLNLSNRTSLVCTQGSLGHQPGYIGHTIGHRIYKVQGLGSRDIPVDSGKQVLGEPGRGCFLEVRTQHSGLPGYTQEGQQFSTLQDSNLLNAFINTQFYLLFSGET